jgi:hypothetical protein
MLLDWQRKFPTSFHEHRALFHLLEEKNQHQLSCLFTLLESKGLLDETTVKCLLQGSYAYLDEINYLVDILIKNEGLTHRSLALLFESNPSVLKTSIEALSEWTPLSLDLLFLLFSHRDPEACAKFIAVSIAAKVDITLVKDFLTNHLQMDGLSRALTLFEGSHFDFRQDHLPLFSILCDILAIPLCQTIFDARLRANSDYDIPTDPIKGSVADALINQLIGLPDTESKIRIFFNFCAQFRPFPASQQNSDEVDVASLVAIALTNDCEAQIQAIQSVDDFITTQQMIKKLKLKGGDPAVFNRIKYRVGQLNESM